MAQKQFKLHDNLTITVYKRRGNRNLRLSLNSRGEVRVSIPAWAPYKAGVEFARSRQAWIEQQLPSRDLLVDGQAIGKAHRLRLRADPVAERVSTRISSNDIIVRYPAYLAYNSPAVQEAAGAAGIRALRRQAEQLLPQRLSALAATHGFVYGKANIKQLRGRWGSCDQRQNITLNLFLMQLPWEFIDYVLLHELTHTRVMKHGPDFWVVMETVCSDAKAMRRKLRDYQPVLLGAVQSAPTMT